MARRAPRPVRVLQGLDHVGLAGLDRGQEAEEHARGHAHDQGEGEHPPVEVELQGEADREGGEKAKERSPRPLGDEHAQGRRGQGEGHALGQELAHQALPARPDGQAHRDLAAALQGAAEEQVRDVRAGDEQHEADHGHEEGGGRHHALARVGVDGGLGDGHGGDASPLVVVRVLALQPLCDGGELGLGLLLRDPGLEASHREHEEAPALLVPVGARLHLLVHGHGHPDLGAHAHVDAGEGLGHDPEHGEGGAVQGEGAAHDPGVGARVLRSRSRGRARPRDRGPAPRPRRGRRCGHGRP